MRNLIRALQTSPALLVYIGTEKQLVESLDGSDDLEIFNHIAVEVFESMTAALRKVYSNTASKVVVYNLYSALEKQNISMQSIIKFFIAFRAGTGQVVFGDDQELPPALNSLLLGNA